MYKIIYSPSVIQKDLPKLNKETQHRIITQIEKKLSVNPNEYGKPLKGLLKSYFRLRIENHRAIYQIKNDIITVYILKIGPRDNSKVYKEVIKRLS